MCKADNLTGICESRKYRSLIISQPVTGISLPLLITLAVLTGNKWVSITSVTGKTYCMPCWQRWYISFPELFALFFCSLFWNSCQCLDYIASNDRMIDDWWIFKNLEGRHHALMKKLAGWAYGEQWKPSLRITIVLAEFRTNHLENARVEH
jgi:hypothetical protein